jgi:hypothetical protein
MTEQSLPRSRRIGLATALAVMSTLLVWWRESGAVSSPGLSTGLVLLLVIGIVAIIWMTRRSVDGSAIDSNGSPHVTRGMARPRPFSEIPREQRRRLILMIGGTSVAFLLLVPIAAVATMRGASWWQAAPLLVVLAAMIVAVTVGWRQVRYPTARTIAIEQDRQKITMSRQVVAYLVFVPAFFAAGVVFQALASAPPLAVTASFTVNVIGAALVVVIDEWLARKPARSHDRHHPLW